MASPELKSLNSLKAPIIPADVLLEIGSIATNLIDKRLNRLKSVIENDSAVVTEADIVIAEEFCAIAANEERGGIVHLYSARNVAALQLRTQKNIEAIASLHIALDLALAGPVTENQQLFERLVAKELAILIARHKCKDAPDPYEKIVASRKASGELKDDYHCSLLIDEMCIMPLGSDERLRACDKLHDFVEALKPDGHPAVILNGQIVASIESARIAGEDGDEAAAIRCLLPYRQTVIKDAQYLDSTVRSEFFGRLSILQHSDFPAASFENAKRCLEFRTSGEWTQIQHESLKIYLKNYFEGFFAAANEGAVSGQLNDHVEAIKTYIQLGKSFGYTFDDERWARGVYAECLLKVGPPGQSIVMYTEFLRNKLKTLESSIEPGYGSTESDGPSSLVVPQLFEINETIEDFYEHVKNLGVERFQEIDSLLSPSPDERLVSKALLFLTRAGIAFDKKIFTTSADILHHDLIPMLDPENKIHAYVIGKAYNLASMIAGEGDDMEARIEFLEKSAEATEIATKGTAHKLAGLLVYCDLLELYVDNEMLEKAYDMFNDRKFVGSVQRNRNTSPSCYATYMKALGQFKLFSGDLESAEMSFKACLKPLREEHATGQIAFVHNMLGTLYYGRATDSSFQDIMDYRRAFRHFDKSQKGFEELGEVALENRKTAIEQMETVISAVYVNDVLLASVSPYDRSLWETRKRKVSKARRSIDRQVGSRRQTKTE